MQTQDAVAKRALALGLIAVRSQVENAIAFRPGEEEKARKMGERLVQWAAELGIDQWLSKSETELHRKGLGTLTHEEITETFWRVESLKAVLWSLQSFPSMPTYFQVGDVNDAYSKIRVKNAADFLKGVRLRRPRTYGPNKISHNTCIGVARRNA